MTLIRIAALVGLCLYASTASAPAQTSCSGFQSMCAARCKQRAPTDANCVSDHCTPKLQDCRASGCWQEGRMYGGKKTCNLAKG